MTQEEIQQQHAAIREEFRVKKAVLAELEVHAQRIGETLEIVGGTLRRDPEALYSPAARQINSNGSTIPPWFDDSYLKQFVDLARVMKVCDDIRVTKARIRELQEMMQKLNLRE